MLIAAEDDDKCLNLKACFVFNALLRDDSLKHIVILIKTVQLLMNYANVF